MFPFLLFFFIDTATTEFYTLSLHDALPICRLSLSCRVSRPQSGGIRVSSTFFQSPSSHTWFVLSNCRPRSEEHTSELQSRVDLVCRLLLEKKKKQTTGYKRQNTNSRHRSVD